MKISIIIPIYNTGEKVRECLDSIKEQTFTDFECLMIDDGSESTTANICDGYAHDDERFIAIHKENGGVSSARNMGIDRARGEWICFVDSDDRIKSEHLSSLIKATSANIDIVLCGYEDVLADNVVIHSYDEAEYENKERLREFFSESDVLSYMIPWDRIYRKEIIKKYNVRFDKRLSISEDRLFCYHYIIYARGIATISFVGYIHDARNEQSLSRRKHSLSTYMYRYKVMSEAKKKIAVALQMEKQDISKLNAYNEDILLPIVETSGMFKLFSLIKFDSKLIIKFIIKKTLCNFLGCFHSGE
ncbi:MAG: glycosyltransferase family 2 protein [Prevotella sp.]|nr:glycosyltransferase family 2 protein [Prevotella sp.]